MFKLWGDKKQSEAAVTWSSEATQALEMALAQAPVPALLKGKVRSELTKAAESATKSAGRSQVTPEDLVNGMMAKLPPDMQQKAKDMIDKKLKDQS